LLVEIVGFRKRAYHKRGELPLKNGQARVGAKNEENLSNRQSGMRRGTAQEGKTETISLTEYCSSFKKLSS
jgi:hypothetical protein